MHRQTSGRDSLLQLGIESLESRMNLAGNVTVALSPAGDLTITGDSAANRIFIALNLAGQIILKYYHRAAV